MFWLGAALVVARVAPVVGLLWVVARVAPVVGPLCVVARVAPVHDMVSPFQGLGVSLGSGGWHVFQVDVGHRCEGFELINEKNLISRRQR